MQFSIALLLLYWMLARYTASESSEFTSEKYHSYLQFPRISFGGRYIANVATGNNIPSNFNNEDFFHFDHFGLLQGGKNDWNAEGTNDFTLIDCHVTSACHVDGKCTEEASVDKICGNTLTDSALSTFAKLVDIDTTFQIVPQIWGLKLSVPGFFEGELESSPLHFLWHRGTSSSDTGESGVFQSRIRNITWAADADSSPVIKQIRELMQYLGSNALSIMSTLDMFHKIASRKNFATGRILGVIGVSGPSAPHVSVWGRSLAPIFPLSETNKGGKDSTEKLHTNHAPFVIDEKKKKLHISFLNSLRTLEGGFPINFPNRTKIGYFKTTKEVGNFVFPAGSCKESAVAIADVSLMNMANLMQKLGGIVDVDLNEEHIEDLSHTPLSIFQSIGDDCNILFMQEYKDGLRVESYEGWVYRLESGQQVAHRLFATKFGKPAQDINISITPSDKEFLCVESTGYQEPRPFTRMIKQTDRHGIANFVFPTRSSNHHMRNGIDGNLEGYAYAIVNSSMSILSKNLKDRLIVARVYHNYSYPDEPTWIDHVLPIFQQYANLFPVMRTRGLDLSNYFDVVDHKEIIQLSLSLPIGHPSYMPVTRDLSQVKKEMILRWLSRDVPPFGDARKLLTKYYLLGLLQRALEVTHATIPPLLTALWSIKKGYNRNIRSVLIQIIDQERYKINIIARIMLSLGGHPKLFHGSFVLSYPSSLPNGIDKDIALSLEMLSVRLLCNVMAIKRRETNKVALSFAKAIFSYADANRGCSCQFYRRNLKCCGHWAYSRIVKKRYKERCSAAATALFKTSLRNLQPEEDYDHYEDPQDGTIFNYHASMDRLFHHILLVLSLITNCGSNNTIFQESNSRKSPASEHLYDYGYLSAINDVRTIMRRTNSMYGKSQYNLLSSIVKSKCASPSKGSCDQDPRGNMGTRNYHWLHSQSDAPPYSIWPIVANMNVMQYPKRGDRDLARAFNDVYTFYLISYEKMLNANTTIRRHEYLSIMQELERAFHVMGHRIVQTPLHSHADKHSGPNMAPTFEVDFEIARTGFLEQRHIISKLKQVNWDLDHYQWIRKQYMKNLLSSSVAKQQDVVIQEEDEQPLSNTAKENEPLCQDSL